MLISAVVVTFNSAGCIECCLQSLRVQQGVTFEIVVVDNASEDDSAVRAAALSPTIRVISNHENVGFGRGNNQGVAVSRGDFLFFLNPDACLEDDRAMVKLVNAMDRHPEWALAGTRVVCAAAADESPLATEYPDQRHVLNTFDRLPGKIAWVLGASMFVRRQVFEFVGGFDPCFFLHSEEADLCLRIRQAGHEIGYAPEVVVRHIGGASEEKADCYAAWRRRMDGLHRFRIKHYAREDVLMLARRDLRRARFRGFYYALAQRLLPGDGARWQKLRRYSAIRDASLDILRAAAVP